MQVILQEDYASLGFVGDLVSVKPGFARNFLIPQKIALPANESNIKLLEHRRRVLEVKKSEKKGTATQLKDKIEGIELRIKHSAGEGDRLFGSVTTAELSKELEAAGFAIDRKLIKLEAPIKTLGEHFVDIKLHQEVSAQVKLIVERTEESKAPKKEVKEKPAKEPKAEPAEAVEETEASDA